MVLDGVPSPVEDVITQDLLKCVWQTKCEQHVFFGSITAGGVLHLTINNSHADLITPRLSNYAAYPCPVSRMWPHEPLLPQTDW